jgi:hypothetical protein
MKRRANIACLRIDSMNPAFYAIVEEKFTTNNSPAVYQDFDYRKPQRNIYGTGTASFM